MPGQVPRGPGCAHPAHGQGDHEGQKRAPQPRLPGDAEPLRNLPQRGPEGPHPRVGLHVAAHRGVRAHLGEEERVSAVLQQPPPDSSQLQDCCIVIARATPAEVSLWLGSVVCCWFTVFSTGRHRGHLLASSLSKNSCASNQRAGLRYYNNCYITWSQGI